ncbi:hypothetical protein HPB49_011321 [Dermacentor silvarum]|uniref:Uncharacterized protein n=1 Tax=Dermacentor silvarum TaxID=543639 RepID=A0ACB8D505_DERSI|nr:hypothetical protein HPB49_011321 [Dermacentor silvarum]
MVEESAVEDPSHTFNTPQPSQRSFACGAVVVFGTMMAIIVLLLLFDESPQQRIKTEPFCCLDVVNRVFSGANLSIDPCRSIFGHTCYAYVATRDDDYREPPRPNTDPVDGIPITEAGRAVIAYYRACVLSTGNSSPGAASASALLDVTDPPVIASLTPQALVALIVDLSLQYGLPSIFEFKIGGAMGSRPYFNVSVASPNALASKHSPTFVKTLKADALKVVNEYFLSKISTQEMNEFLEDIEKSRAEVAERYLGSLTDLTPNVTAGQWREILNKLRVSDLANATVFLQVTKEKFADSLKPEKRLHALVSALVSASVQLALSAFIEASSTDARTQACRHRAKELIPLLILDRIGNSPTRSQNAAIRTAYHMIAGAVRNKARVGMTKDDSKKLQETLKEMTVLLPSEVVPGDLAIPTMTSEYAHAELVTRAYLLSAWRHQTFTLGISQDALGGFQENHVTIGGGKVTIPTLVYPLITLGQVTDPVVLMPTVGVYLADALWDFVFTSTWSPESNATLTAYRECIEKNSRSLIEWPSDLLWLSVESSLEASKGVDWDTLVDTAGTWNTTRGQLFYMTFVHYLLCRTPHSRYPTFGIDVDVFMSAFEDFYRSFRCNTTVSKITGATCSLHL